MKQLLLMLAALITFGTTAQVTSPKLSPLTKKYLKEIKQTGEGESLVKNYVYKTGQGTVYISALIKVGDNISDQKLNALGVKIGTKAGNIWTAQVPVENVEPFLQLPGIEYIQLDEPALPDLDSARANTRVDSVHSGINIPMPLTGSGVVMGVVDAGYDWRHPTFLDITGNHYRIKKVWMQKNSSGTPPAGYVYGTEETDSAALAAIGNDNGGSHGTHVGGICAGSGIGSPNAGAKFKGIAYNADLVCVAITPDKSQWVSTGVSDMIDGINYIFDYAATMSKPAIVNLSWGSPLGPRNGTGLFSQALDNLTGPGRIFSCSAGNNGDDSIHIGKTFTPSDSIVQTFLDISDSPEGKKTWIDIWGDSSKTFCVQVSIYHSGSIASTGFVCIDDSTHDFILIGSTGDTLLVSFYTSSSEFNNQPRVFLDFDSRLTTADSILISVSGTDGSINFWNTFVSNTSGYYGAFRAYGYPWATVGNNSTTISDIASSKSAITVGAHASKVSWTDINNSSWSYSTYVSPGNLVPFSSRGPALDGRIKPDITAPGLTVGSAISSYDMSFSGSNIAFIVNQYTDPHNSRAYRYGMLSGTSMASPAVSGIIALLLEVKSTLDPDEIKDLFEATSIRDAWTGALPPGGTNNWGNGKVNAYRSVWELLQQVNKNNIAGGDLDCILFPNPSVNNISIGFSALNVEKLSVEIFDLTGKSVHNEDWNTQAGFNQKSIDMTNFSKGIYFVNVYSPVSSKVLKAIVE